jgi:predicted solute-binding protein
MVGRDRRARRVGRMLRVGCVKYLNARPLIRGWQGPAEFDHPSALCKRLANGELDVALVSSFEFLRNPIYRMVDDVSISSNGPVFSVVMAHRGEISQIEEIELDSASETAVNLLRCLLAELGLKPRLESGVPGSIGCQPVFVGSLPTTHKARLFIGDHAIRFRQKHASEFNFWDLGEQWKKLVALPFVYALWLVRPEVADPKPIANHLRALRDENLANLDGLIEDTVAGFADSGQWKELNQEFLSRYYRNHLRFSFGEKEKQGLQTFANLCAKHGLLPKHDLTFSLV